MADMTITDDDVEYDLEDDTLYIDMQIAVNGYLVADTRKRQQRLAEALAERLGVDPEDVCIQQIHIEKEMPTLPEDTPDVETIIECSVVLEP